MIHLEHTCLPEKMAVTDSEKAVVCLFLLITPLSTGQWTRQECNL